MPLPVAPIIPLENKTSLGPISAGGYSLKKKWFGEKAVKNATKETS